MRSAVLTGLIWDFEPSGRAGSANEPGTPIPESGPSQSSSGAATAVAMDFNSVRLSLLIAVVVLALWYIARRPQSGSSTR
ncbi:hypothetical protein ACRAWG_36925 [Methylobacterium sp. P31]